MGFRFRRTFSVIPGVRINFGKRGASVSVGVRGAHVTMGSHGTRASVGIPGTGASYTARIDQAPIVNSDVSSASPWIAVPAILLAIGVSVAIAFAVNKAFDVGAILFFGTIIVCLPWLLSASNRQPNTEGRDVQPPPLPPPLPARNYHQIMEEAQARQRVRAAERAAAESLLREEERVTQLLNQARCFYKNGDEQVGPVSFFRVRELIEMDLLTPDVQVIAEGSDYWRTYAEWELIVVPPRDHPTFSKLSKAAHLSCFYLDQGREVGPISLLAIFHYIRSGKLSPDVQIRTDGSQNWVPASRV